MTVGDPREHRTAPHHRTAHLCTAGWGSRGQAAPREHTLVARVLVDPPACRVIVVTLLDETRDSRGTPLTRRRLASRVSLYNVISIVILPTCDALEGKRGTPPDLQRRRPEFFLLATERLPSRDLPVCSQVPKSIILHAEIMHLTLASLRYRIGAYTTRAEPLNDDPASMTPLRVNGMFGDCMDAHAQLRAASRHRTRTAHRPRLAPVLLHCCCWEPPPRPRLARRPLKTPLATGYPWD